MSQKNDQLAFKVKDLENRVEYGFVLNVEQLLFLIGNSDKGHIRSMALERFLELYGFITR